MREFLRGLKTVNGRAALALVYTALVLTVLEFWFHPVKVQMRLLGRPLYAGEGISLRAGLEWAAACTVGYFVVPLLIVLFIHRERPSSIGIRFQGFFRHVWIYLGLYGVMLPFILWAAKDPAFLRTYPFVSCENWDEFIRWQIGYVIQFIALEAFFRGYLLFSLAKSQGWTAIFVMSVPYCMIHYHKPPLEAFGAIAAGIALGTLALRLRSWFGGALLHALVAVTMDSLSWSRTQGP